MSWGGYQRRYDRGPSTRTPRFAATVLRVIPRGIDVDHVCLERLGQAILQLRNAIAGVRSQFWGQLGNELQGGIVKLAAGRVG
jgi:hypothetical protein